MKAIANRYLIPALALAVATAAGTAAGNEATTAAPAAPAAMDSPIVSPTDSPIDPAAVEALAAMSGYLRSLPHYSIDADISKDKVIAGNGKLQFDHVLKVYYLKGKGLRMDSSSPRRHLEYFYNHKQFTLFTPRKHFYVTVDAPPTIGATMDLIEDKYDLSLPLSDIFYWGTAKAPTDAIEAAFVVGTGRVDGQDCRHYAYRQADVDWQLCITEGDKPLPLKLVITTTDLAIQPQYVATLQWNLEPTIEPASFTFVPPKGASKITFSPVADATAATAEEH